MKKVMTLTSLALLVAVASFAGVGEDRLFVQPNATFSSSPVLLTSTNTNGTQYDLGLLTGPSTTNNDDSCDISVMPAATLLIPYFEVDFANPSSDARNTVFSITNTTPQPQIAHVTVWTDWSFPVLDFNLWLTGYDVVPVSLYDLIRNGNIPRTGADDDVNSPLPQDDANIGVFTTNPNHTNPPVGSLGTSCDELPGPIPVQLRTAIQSALTTGEYPLENVGGADCDELVGGDNDVAVGYITIDVVAFCSQQLPTDPDFYDEAILWDNSIIGDYMILNSSTADGNWAGGTPMVHIRAVPEGGPEENDVLGTPDFGTRAAAVNAGSNLPYTFYNRYLNASQELVGADRRQPLPGVFAARFIEDDPTGPTGFDTRLIIWREGVTEGNFGCSDDVWFQNAALIADAIVRFDERENGVFAEGGVCDVSPCIGVDEFVYEETQAINTANESFFPPDFDGTDDLGGWMYLDLNGANAEREESQAWVVVNMTAEGRYGVLYDAAAMGNGCSPAPETQPYDGEYMIRPAPNVTPASPTPVVGGS